MSEEKYTKKRMRGIVQFLKELLPLAALVAFAMVVIAVVPDWHHIPYGFIRLGCVIAGGMLLRCYWDTTISEYIYKGGYVKDFRESDGRTKLILSVVVKLVYACIAAACFVL